MPEDRDSASMSQADGTDLLMTALPISRCPRQLIRSIVRLVQPTTGPAEQRLPRP